MSCYDCHPGAQTQCLRDVMFSNGSVCTDCHGSLAEVGRSIRNGRKPWIDEPRCDGCHDAQHAENTGTLYRNSTGHGGLHCTACHNSPHAVLPTVQPRDGVQALRVQGDAGYIKNCLVCHTTQPVGAGPHGVLTSWNILLHLMGANTLQGELLARADYDQDGRVDIGDAVYQINRGL
jgi:hypothetical protein